MLNISQASTFEGIAAVRALMLEYQVLLGVDLCFQGFDAEVRDLPGSYAFPRARLLLATDDAAPVGCVALHEASWPRAEMKRRFVRPSGRGLGLGRALVSAVLAQSVAIGYTEVVRDTLPSIAEAQLLYEQFGFRDIPPYRPNPVQGARYPLKSLVDA